MMYPRLVLARNLLTPDGVIAISIDSNEVAHLRTLLDEVFGAENYLNTFVWVSNLKGRQISGGGAVGTHEYILLYGRNAGLVAPLRGSFSALKELMPSVYKGGGYEVKNDKKGPYVTKNELYNTNSSFNEVTRPTLIFRIHFNPNSAEVRVTDVDDDTTFPGFVTAMPHRNSRPNLSWHAWRWSRAKVLAESEELEFKVDGDLLRIWTKIRDVDGVDVKDLIIGPSTVSGQADLDKLGLKRLFDTPKPVDLLQVLVGATTSGADVVLDFFAGSGSTAHAVCSQNDSDGGVRSCVSVNLPEATPPESDAFKAGYRTVSAITEARLRQVLDFVPGAITFGLRVLRLAESSFRILDEEIAGIDLFDFEEATLSSREPDMDAVAAEVLLKEGVLLGSSWNRHPVGQGSIIMAEQVAVACSVEITDQVIGDAFAMKPRTVTFLEDGFAGNDMLKANAFIRARELGITMKTV
jgi:adenine-specific DNA-methyltransferase